MNDLYITIYFGLLFLTSINYWRKPEYGFRRNIDMLVVYIGVFIMLFQACLLKNEMNRYIYLSMGVCAIIFYITEHIMVYFNNSQWIIFHMTLHIYVSLSVILVIFN